MKIDKNLFIGVLLVLVMLCIIGTASAVEPLNENQTATDVGGEAISDIADEPVSALDSEGELSAAGDTITVASDGTGDYSSISAAAGAATGGETIFIKNGEYTETAKIDIGTKQLSFIGESQGGVIIKSGDNDLFYTTSSGYSSLVFNNLVFKDISMTGARTPIFIGGDGNVSIANCLFDNCASRYGALRIYTSGSVVVDQCEFLDTKSSTGSYSSAIDFGGSGNTEFVLKNSIIDSSAIASSSTASYILGTIYNEKSAGTVILDNVTISNFQGNGKGRALITSKGNMNIRNSRFVNNEISEGNAYNAIIFISAGGKTVNIETSIIANNSEPNYIVSSNSGTSSFNLNYNNIQNNSVKLGVNHATSGSYTLDANYWGSNSLPDGITASTWIVEDNGVYKLNNGEAIDVIIPGLNDGPEPKYPADTIFVAKDGSDDNNGSEDSPVLTIAKGVELANAGSGFLVIKEGVYTESGIQLNNSVPISIVGDGNVVIDGQASTTSIFVMDGGSANFINIVFTNNKPRYGGAINAGSSVNINILVNNCTFADINSTSRGGAIYAATVKGKLTIKDSKFYNIDSGSWGAITIATSSQSDGLTVDISGSTFENNKANNGAALYLRAANVNIVDSSFINNTAVNAPGAIYLYNATATIDNCIIVNNTAGAKGVAISSTPVTGAVTKLTITNSVIENNNGNGQVLPAIYADQNLIEISYSSIINELSIETRTAAGYDAVYGQGVVIANNNWWGTNDPSTVVTGINITIDSWVIMNVEANASEVLAGDQVQLAIDFNHVNTTSGEIQELAGGEIPIDSYTVKLTSQNGTFSQDTVEVKKGRSQEVIFTSSDNTALIQASCGDAAVDILLAKGVEPYYGIIYVSADGNDNNNGSELYPVSSIAKAIQLASVNGGSGEIIINPGTYTGTNYEVTKDLTVTGVGNVVIDGEGQGRLFNVASAANVNMLSLNNLILTGGDAYFGSIIYSYAKELILENISMINNPTSGNLITNNGKLTINKSKFVNNTCGDIIKSAGNYDITITNSTFENNTVTGSSSDYGIVYISSGRGNLVVEDSRFINNTARQGVLIGSSDTNIDVKGCDFIDNTNTVAYGGAIRASSQLNVVDSIFINNKALKDGGAIYIGFRGEATVTKSVFIDNAVTSNGYYGDAIYNGNKLSVNYCVLLSNGTRHVIYNDGEDNVVNAQYNWWGTNDDPSSLNGAGEYEDDDGYDVLCADVDSSNWVVMTVSNNLTDEINVGDKVEFTVDFTHTNNGQVLADSIPEIDVSASALYGQMDAQEAITANNVAKFVYTAVEGGEDSVTITSSNAVNVTPISVKVPVVLEVIYVSMSGDDNNDGSRDAPVATLKHAIEIAERGKIVIMNGDYTITETLIIDKDLDITGMGTVTINGNQLGIMENSANLNLTNIVFTNAKLATGSVIKDNGNTTINGCTFYSCVTTSGSSAGPVNNLKGTMVINNSKFYQNKGARGVVASQQGTKLIINNSEFYDNDCTSITNCYGIVYSTSAETTVENTIFRNNKDKQGGAIWASRSTSATTGSLEVINCTFENNVANVGTGGAIFASGNVDVNVEKSTFINNTAIKSASGVGGNGGAIYSTGNSIVTVTDSIFIDNAGDADAGIYADGVTFTISNSVILAKSDDTNFALNKVGSTVTANDNFWGDNSKANTNANVARWIIMNASYTKDDQGVLTITATFDKTNSTSGEIADYAGSIPDGFDVTFTSTSGNLNEVVPVKNAQASVQYTLDKTDSGITVKVANSEVTFPFEVAPEVIYVSPSGDDSNNGERDTPVATLAHAVEIAENGQIVLLEGTYKTGYLGIISNDLNITGEGKVIIDAENNNRILYVGEDAKVVLKDLIMINGYGIEGSGALLGNSNYLTIINCTLANSSAGENNGGAIYNVGYLTIINSTVANNIAKEGGAIFANDALAKGVSIVIENSLIENNIATGNDNLGGGAIFTQQIATLSVTNTSFRNNKAESTSSGGAIFISHSTATLTIKDSEFIANHANGQEGTGGGAIYMAGTSNYERKGTLTISNTLFEDNTAGTNGGAVYARATTINIANSVLLNNKDANGLAVYGYKTEQVSPSITLNDNWWGSNDKPSDLVGGNSNYKPTLNRWAILTIANDTPIVQGNTVKLTVSINSWTNGEENGTLANPIKVERPVSLRTTSGIIDGVLENGEFSYDYLVPANLKIITATVDNQSETLFVITSETVLTVENITAFQGETVKVNIIVKTTDGADVKGGTVELYFDNNLVATIPVTAGVASQDVIIANGIGTYSIKANYSDATGEFIYSEDTATLNVTGVNNVVTPETFSLFFDENGNLKSDLPFDELYFEGTFENMGVITIGKPIKITGRNAQFKDTAFKLDANDVVLSDVSIELSQRFDKTDGAAIYIGGNNVVVSNSNITYNAPDNVQSYAIEVDVADNVKIINNNINYNAKSDGTVKTIAINALDSDNLVVENNVLNANVPSVDIDYSAYPIVGYNSQGVHIEKSNNVSFDKNDITVNYGNAAGYADTIYAVHFEDSNNSRVTNNGIELNGHNYAYGLVTNYCENITISGNDIKSSSDDHYAAGLQVGGKSTASVDNNNISAKSNEVVYPVYLDDWYMGGEVNLTNNNIKGESDTVYGVYVEEDKVLISGNTIEAVGNHVYGVVTHQTDAIIDGNDINATGRDVGDIVSPQSGVNENTTGIIVSEGKAEITNNNVVTTGKSTIAAINTNATVKNNGLTANGTTADDSISSVNSTVVTSGNTAAKDKDAPTTPVVKITGKNNAKVDYGFTYSVRVTEDGKSVGAGKVVTLKIAGKTLKAKTDKNGYAKFTLAVKPKAYTVTVTYNKVSQKYKVTVKNVIKAKNLKVKKSAKRLKVKVTLKTSAKKPIKGKKVVLKIKGKKYKAKTNKKGVATFKVKKNLLKKLKAGKKYKYQVTYGKDTVKKTLKVKK